MVNDRVNDMVNVIVNRTTQSDGMFNVGRLGSLDDLVTLSIYPYGAGHVPARAASSSRGTL